MDRARYDRIRLAYEANRSLYEEWRACWLEDRGGRPAGVAGLVANLTGRSKSVRSELPAPIRNPKK